MFGGSLTAFISQLGASAISQQTGQNVSASQVTTTITSTTNPNFQTLGQVVGAVAPIVIPVVGTAIAGAVIAATKQTPSAPSLVGGVLSSAPLSPIAPVSSVVPVGGPGTAAPLVNS